MPRKISHTTHYALYAIGPCIGGPCKVGVAADVRERLATLQIGNWVRLGVLLEVYTLNARDAFKAEAIAHRRLGRS